MLQQSEIQQYGGKAAILNHIAKELPDMPIPRYIVKEAGKDLLSVSGEVRSFRQPLIVRSSSPHEYAGFEGIFKSVENVGGGDLERAVKAVEESAMSENAQRYAAMHGVSIDEQMHVIIQEQSDSKYQGAMMRHPNNPDLIYITQFFGKGRKTAHYSGIVFNERTKERSYSRVAVNSGMDNNSAQFLVDRYRELESLTELSDGEVLYVEFGSDPFKLYQARPFKRIETANFDLPVVEQKYSLHTDLAFGITSPEGIVLPVLRSVGHIELDFARESAKKHFLVNEKTAGIKINYGDSEMDWALNMMNLGGMHPEYTETRQLFAQMMTEHHAEFDRESDGPYCFMTSSAKTEDYEVDLTIPNMRTLVLGQAQCFLTHGLMRLIKQAEVTFAYGTALAVSELYRGTKTREHKVRIISNGKEAIVMRE